MALTKKQVKVLVDTINESMAALQNEFGKRNAVDARISFPRGWFSRAEDYRRTLPNIGTERQRRNASYSMMHVDLLRWIVVRTDVSNAILSLAIKDAISVRGEICEWMLNQATSGKKKSYKTRTQNLVDAGTITEDLKVELDWIWDQRNNSHLSNVAWLEYDRYSRADYNRALAASKELCEVLVKLNGCAS